MADLENSSSDNWTPTLHEMPDFNGSLKRNITDILSLLESPAKSDSPTENQNTTQLLSDIVAYVEVRTDNENRSRAIERELQYMGASIVPKLTSDVTHVIFKDGKKSTKEKAKKKNIHLVSVLWVDSCKRNQEKMPEDLYPISKVEDTGTPIMFLRNKKTKGKSMQPKDFDEEVACSAGRGEKRRRRKALAERFKNVASPYKGSDIKQIYVEETQPKTPSSDSSSPHITVPDTPLSMKGKMSLYRVKQKLCLDGGEDSTPVVGQIFSLKKRLFGLNVIDSDEEEINSSSQVNTYRQMSVLESPMCSQESQPPEPDSINTPNLPSLSSSPSEFISEMPVNPVVIKEVSDTKENLSNIKKAMNIATHMEMEGIQVNLKSTCSEHDDSSKETVNPDVIKRKSISLKNGLVMPEKVTIAENSGDTNSFEKRFQSKTKFASVHLAGNMHATPLSLESQVKEEASSSNDKQCPDFSLKAVNVDGKPVVKRLPQKRKLLAMSDGFPPLNELIEPTKASNTMQTKGVLYEPKKYSARGKRSRKASEEIEKNIVKRTLKETSIGSESVPSNRRKKSMIDETTHDNHSEKAFARDKIPVINENHVKEPVILKAEVQNKVDECDTESVKSVPKTPTRFSMRRRSMMQMPMSELVMEEKGLSKLEHVKVNCRRKSVATACCPGMKEPKKPNSFKETNESKKDKENSWKNPERRQSVRIKSLVGHTTELNQAEEEEQQHSKINKCPVENGVTAESDAMFSDSSVPERTLDETSKPNTSSTHKSVIVLIPKSRRSIDEFSKSQICKPASLALLSAGDGSLVNCSMIKKKKHFKQRSQSISCITTKVIKNGTDIKPRTQSTKEGRPRKSSSTSESEKSDSGNISKCTKSIVMTSLHSDEQDVVHTVVKKLGEFHVVDKVVLSTTHVICGSQRRTLNVLYAIAKGCWLVTYDWVWKSLEAGKWLDEEPYEMHEHFPAAKINRLGRLLGDDKCPSQHVFSECKLIYVSEQTAPPCYHLARLITMCGGQVTTCVRKAQISVGSMYKKDIITVSEKWVLDSITSNKCLPYQDYEVVNISCKRSSSPDY